MSLEMLIEENLYTDNTLNEVCIACGDIIKHQNNSVSNYLLSGEPPIKFFDALKLLTNFSELEQEHCPQYACDECFNKANMILHFQKVCNNSVNVIKEYIADKKYKETLIECDPNDVNDDGSASETDNDSDYDPDKKPRTKIKKEDTLYLCPVCGKSFKASMYLKRHIRTHGEGRHICNVCNKRFHQKTHLQNHSVTHTGERPFLCDECPKRFGTKKHLKQHQVSHAAVMPFQCQNCGTGFRHKITLKSHLLKSCHIPNVPNVQNVPNLPHIANVSNLPTVPNINPDGRRIEYFLNI